MQFPRLLCVDILCDSCGCSPGICIFVSAQVINSITQGSVVMTFRNIAVDPNEMTTEEENILIKPEREDFSGRIE